MSFKVARRSGAAWPRLPPPGFPPPPPPNKPPPSPPKNPPPSSPPPSLSWAKTGHAVNKIRKTHDNRFIVMTCSISEIQVQSHHNASAVIRLSRSPKERRCLNTAEAA